MDYRRERNRKERSKAEMMAMLKRYWSECGECITRKATEEEMNRKVEIKKEEKPFVFYN